MKTSAFSHFLMFGLLGHATPGMTTKDIIDDMMKNNILDHWLSGISR